MPDESAGCVADEAIERFVERQRTVEVRLPVALHRLTEHVPVA